MMLCKTAIFAALIFITIVPAVFSFDTLKVEATLDADRKAISGSVLVRIPDTFHDDIIEFYLPPNRHVSGDADYQEYPAGLNSAGFRSSLTVDTIMLDGNDVTARFSVTGTLGALARGELPAAGKMVKICFTTHLPEYGTSLLATDGEYFLGGWYPLPAILPDGRRMSIADNDFVTPIGDYFNYEVSFTAPENLVAVAPIQPSGVAAGGNSRTYAFRFGPAIDFAMALSPYYAVDSTVRSGIVMKYHYRDYESKLIEDIRNATVYAFDYMNEHVGTYIYPELHVVLINTAQPVGLEYPGLVALFSPRGGALISNYYEYLAIREVVHQWFYAMISADQCREPWLNKSIAEYFALKIADDYWGQDANLVNYGGFKATFTDDLRLNARLAEGRSAVNSRSDQFAHEMEFTATVGDRGALTVATICNLLGDSLEVVFWKSYYEASLLKRVTTDSFLTRLNEIGGPNIKEQAQSLLNAAGSLDFSVSALTYRPVDSITYESRFILSRSGTAAIPVEYDVILYNNDTLSFIWDSDKYSEAVHLEAPYPARAVIVDPNFRMAIDDNLLNNSTVISTDGRPAWRLSSGMMFLIESLFSMMGGW